MTKRTLTKFVRIHTLADKKNVEGKTVGKEWVERATPLPADPKNTMIIKDEKGKEHKILIAAGQIINPKKYFKRLQRRARKTRI